uniref:PNPLA domain-containing protein n=1 Tax=Salix viminalis TaxID=40686 RepID=A0A6N2KVM6_SALVM
MKPPLSSLFVEVGIGDGGITTSQALGSEAPNIGGKVPERLFLDTSKTSREDIFPIHPGICPCKLLFESILPVKKLLDRSNSCSELMLPNEEGMLPVKLLLDRSNSCSELMLPNEEGMLPSKPLSDIIRNSYISLSISGFLYHFVLWFTFRPSDLPYILTGIVTIRPLKGMKAAYYFDFIAGTSTGGLMTSMLTAPNDENDLCLLQKILLSFIKTIFQAPTTVWNFIEVVFYGDSSFRVWGLFFVKENESLFQC